MMNFLEKFDRLCDMSENTTENPLGYEKIPVLLRKFAVPGIIAMLVNSIYNIVDQIFIGWGVGYLGNAATNVAFPVTVIAIAVFLSLGVGGATRYSIYLGEKRHEDAAKGGHGGQSLCLSQPAFRRAAAARGNRQRSGHRPGDHPLR